MAIVRSSSGRRTTQFVLITERAAGRGPVCPVTLSALDGHTWSSSSSSSSLWPGDDQQKTPSRPSVRPAAVQLIYRVIGALSGRRRRTFAAADAERRTRLAIFRRAAFISWPRHSSIDGSGQESGLRGC